MNSSMACRNSVVLLLLSPRNAFRDKMLNQTSTWFSQLAEVGVHGDIHRQLLARRLRIGEAGKVVFIKPLTHGRLDRIGTLGLIPGAILQLKQKRPTVVLDIGQTTVAIDREIADEVYVRRASADDTSA